jgi:hypothetical protein
MDFRDGRFLFFAPGWRAFFSSLSACRCDLSDFVRFSDMPQVSHRLGRITMPVDFKLQRRCRTERETHHRRYNRCSESFEFLFSRLGYERFYIATTINAPSFGYLGILSVCSEQLPGFIPKRDLRSLFS